MSSLLFALMRENPIPGLAAASLNVVVALCLVAMSLTLGITIATIAWVHSPGERKPSPIRLARRTIA
ncbi:hypothetical protein [uncultured Bradyrhizobium sp.]|jgi:hypothetical protein|uniref:hypothetical protein n=1 Tax=uncultured Bradyrhizobium sp. TaxID=199684 RepID=UPI00262634C9|nr:hypothetical protein [uncultured Bradyrhizobium sp.]